MPEYIEFQNQAQFDLWHDSVKTALGIPPEGRIGNRNSDGVPQPNKQRTIAYVQPLQHASDPAQQRVMAAIDDDILPPEFKQNQTVVDEAEAKSRGYVPTLDDDGVVIPVPDNKPDTPAPVGGRP